MNIKLQIPDSVYQSLMAGGNRIQGSIGLVSPTEGNFNAHRRLPYERPQAKYIRLRHGKASVTQERVSLVLRIDRREADIVPHQVMELEAQEACDFVFAHE